MTRRGTRQKIEEPPTPYHYGSDDEHESSEANEIQPPKHETGDIILNNWEILRAKLQYEQSKQQNTVGELTSRGSISVSSSPNASSCCEAFTIHKESRDEVLPIYEGSSHKEDIDNTYSASVFVGDDGHVLTTSTYGFDTNRSKLTQASSKSAMHITMSSNYESYA